MDYIGNEPKRMSEKAAGFDLISKEKVYVKPGEVKLIGSDSKLDMPDALMGMLLPRSSIHKKGLILCNSVGLIDPDYQGELMFAFRNFGDKTAILEAGERIGQIVFIANVSGRIVMNKVEEFTSKTERGEGGFGSTGKGA